MPVILPRSATRAETHSATQTDGPPPAASHCGSGSKLPYKVEQHGHGAQLTKTAGSVTVPLAPQEIRISEAEHKIWVMVGTALARIRACTVAAATLEAHTSRRCRKRHWQAWHAAGEVHPPLRLLEVTTRLVVFVITVGWLLRCPREAPPAA